MASGFVTAPDICAILYPQTCCDYCPNTLAGRTSFTSQEFTTFQPSQRLQEAAYMGSPSYGHRVGHYSAGKVPHGPHLRRSGILFVIAWLTAPVLHCTARRRMRRCKLQVGFPVCTRRLSQTELMFPQFSTELKRRSVFDFSTSDGSTLRKESTDC